MKKKILLTLLLFFGTAIFVLAQDSDGDGVPNATDCAPNDATKWASVIYFDGDGDGFALSVTGCFGGTLASFSWLVFVPDEGSYLVNVSYSYSDVPPLADGDDNNP